MSATDTALRVIGWAETGEGEPPAGDLRGAPQLASPPDELRVALARLTVQMAAHLRLGAVPMGDRGSINLSAVLLAAAIGVVKSPNLVHGLVQSLPQPEGPLDWIARHAVVAPVLRRLTAEQADDFRAASPLTAVIDRPPGDVDAFRDGEAMQVIERMLADRAARLALVLHFAEPTELPSVRDWRRSVLKRFRSDRFVLDVYEAMMIHHEAEALDQVNRAQAALDGGLTDEDSVRDAISIADWWGPLAELRRADGELLRARRYLGYRYLNGIALYQAAQRFPRVEC